VVLTAVQNDLVRKQSLLGRGFQGKWGAEELKRRCKKNSPIARSCLRKKWFSIREPEPCCVERRESSPDGRVSRSKKRLKRGNKPNSNVCRTPHEGIRGEEPTAHLRALPAAPAKPAATKTWQRQKDGTEDEQRVWERIRAGDISYHADNAGRNTNTGGKRAGKKNRRKRKNSRNLFRLGPETTIRRKRSMLKPSSDLQREVQKKRHWGVKGR